MCCYYLNEESIIYYPSNTETHIINIHCSVTLNKHEYISSKFQNYIKDHVQKLSFSNLDLESSIKDAVYLFKKHNLLEYKSYSFKKSKKHNSFITFSKRNYTNLKKNNNSFMVRTVKKLLSFKSQIKKEVLKNNK